MASLFSKLSFNDHPNCRSGTQARLFFPNGYGVSVITGQNAYSDSFRPYELAVLKGSIDNSEIDYSTDITDDVIGYLDVDSLEVILNRVKNL